MYIFNNSRISIVCLAKQGIHAYLKIIYDVKLRTRAASGAVVSLTSHTGLDSDS